MRSNEPVYITEDLATSLQELVRVYEAGLLGGPPAQGNRSGVSFRRSKATAPGAIADGALGSIILKVGPDGDERDGDTVEARNRSGQDISAGDTVTAEYPVHGRWAIMSGPGGECTCQEVHEIRIDGTATAGTISVDYTVGGSSGSASINYNSTAAAAKTALISGHSFFNTNNINVYDGPFPNAGLYIVFGDDLAGLQIRLPAVTSSLTGGGVGKAYRTSSGAEYAP